ncbi:MAG: hypothetical protein L3J36_05435 [Rhodobacteraceae bacterium]|nr:hypothetical protein [Paracoccaceae bacterium]
MLPNVKAILFALILTGVASGPSDAQQSGTITSYSATAIHAAPGQPETTGIVIKSGENMRLEYEQNGQRIVQILLPEQGVMYILEPTSQSYFELRGQAVPNTIGTGSATPCDDQSGLALCKRVGSDTVSGISVERWLMASLPQTKPLSILWDPTRRQALRQDYPDGASMVMRFKSMQTLNGRAAEYWSIKTTTPGHKTKTGGWWFDPELRVVVREELPGGEVRRLENIIVGAVDPVAFTVPQGWQKRESAAILPPQPSPPPASE